MKNKLAITFGLALVLALTLTSTTLATITDDINPQGSAVIVSLSNPGSSLAKGWVSVTADLGGSSVTKAQPFMIAPGGQAQVIVRFGSTVQGVIDLGITEGPDPILQ